jgi:suppressor for copper-sensitivity B
VISRFLAQHNRYGIPLNVVYGPKAPQGIVLPEVTSAETMVQAIKQAQGK